jgi:hypothetical protein
MVYKAKVRYYHNNIGSIKEFSEVFYYIEAKDIKEAIQKCEFNTEKIKEKRPQCNEVIQEIGEADLRVSIIK